MALSLTVSTRGRGARVAACTLNLARLRPRVKWIAPPRQTSGEAQILGVRQPGWGCVEVYGPAYWPSSQL